MALPARMLAAAAVCLVMAGPGALGSHPLSLVQEARQYLDRQDFFSAIALLEPALPGSQNNPDLLNLLRRAYQGRSRELLAQGRTAEAQLYLDRLSIIDPTPAATGGPGRTASQAARPQSPRVSPEPGPVKTAVAPSRPADEVAEPPDGSAADSLAQALRPPGATPPSIKPGRDAAPARPARPVPPAASDDALTDVEPEPSDAPVKAAARSQPRPAAVQTATAAERKPPAGAAPGPDVAREARDALGRADRKFAGGDFAAAESGYARAVQLQPTQPQEVRDRWAYCRAVAAATRIRANPIDRAEWRRLEAEVRRVIELSPKNWYARYLHGVIADHLQPVTMAARPPEPIVRGKAADDDQPPETARRATAPLADAARPAVLRRFSQKGWQVLETPNFLIYHLPAHQTLGAQVAQVAEFSRQRMYVKWYGSLPASDWSPKCEILVYPDGPSFAQATGQGPLSPGVSTIGNGDGIVHSRRITLRGDYPSMLKAVLPHEITHVVLGDKFVHGQVPRWADEGMAIQAEPAEKQEQHQHNLANALARGTVFPINQLMTMGEYPANHLWGVFYAESASLVQFLVARGTGPQFVDFLSGSLNRGNYEAELQRVYGIKDFAELEHQWRESLTGGTQIGSAAGSPKFR